MIIGIWHLNSNKVHSGLFLNVNEKRQFPLFSSVLKNDSQAETVRIWIKLLSLCVMFLYVISLALPKFLLLSFFTHCLTSEVHLHRYLNQTEFVMLRFVRRHIWKHFFFSFCWIEFIFCLPYDIVVTERVSHVLLIFINIT